MTEETTKQIEKPWAVYSSGIGKVVRQDSNGKIWITSFEANSPEWVPKEIQTFGNSTDAINYFFAHQSYQPKYSKENMIVLFLDQFPSEKNNLELLAQSLPKCTPSFKLELCGDCRRHEKTC